ncbi:ANTAR domain-containing response regulator [Butyrivibrio sp. MC2013]|uniref:ANTAR domain-containing response regulator n=1 Tax=Butyrivibrio sp. MC2013 TaxID=1280686 RepID=UPI00041444D9|nr:ANTAR domain-containing protein [Butyrivibrio sp. MC2013]
MSSKKDIYNSILIVSDSDRFTAIVKKSLAGFITIDVRKDASTARRSVLEKDYDIVIIDSPLCDEAGPGLAIDVADRSGACVMLVSPEGICEDVMEEVTDYGVLVLPGPFPAGRMDKAIRYLISVRSRITALQEKVTNAQDKLEELRIVSKAKILLVEKRHMTEDEAHRFIGKQAMNNGVSRRRIAQYILDEF